MASLTPLSKGLIGLVVLGGMASAVWHLGLKERFGGNATQQPVTTTVPDAPVVPAVPTVTPATPVIVPAPAAPAQVSTVQSAKMSPAEHAEAGRKLLDGGDFAQARVHLEQAVQGGDSSAACLLGDMTLKGQGGIPASQDKAASLFQLAQSHNTICFAAGK